MTIKEHNKNIVYTWLYKNRIFVDGFSELAFFMKDTHGIPTRTSYKIILKELDKWVDGFVEKYGL